MALPRSSVIGKTSLCQIDPDFEAKSRTVMEFHEIVNILCVQKKIKKFLGLNSVLRIG